MFWLIFQNCSTCDVMYCEGQITPKIAYEILRSLRLFTDFWDFFWDFQRFFKISKTFWDFEISRSFLQDFSKFCKICEHLNNFWDFQRIDERFFWEFLSFVGGYFWDFLRFSKILRIFFGISKILWRFLRFSRFIEIF